MLARYAVASVIFAVVAFQASAQDDQYVEQTIKLVVSDGPYEVKGESGVIGFVVARAGDVVTFKPCLGNSFTLDRRKLQKTSFQCQDSPPSEENPLVVNCARAFQGWDANQVAQAFDSKEAIGTTFSIEGGSSKVVTAMMNPQQVAATIDGAYQLVSCGRSVVGVDKEGGAKVNLIQATGPLHLEP